MIVMPIFRIYFAQLLIQYNNVLLVHVKHMKVKLLLRLFKPVTNLYETKNVRSTIRLTRMIFIGLPKLPKFDLKAQLPLTTILAYMAFRQ